MFHRLLHVEMIHIGQGFQAKNLPFGGDSAGLLPTTGIFVALDKNSNLY